MTPKDLFLEGTFWDKIWRPIRSRALLFTPEEWSWHERDLFGATSNDLAKDAPKFLPKCLGLCDDLVGPKAQDLGAPK